LILRQKGILNLKKLTLKQFVAGLTGKMEQEQENGAGQAIQADIVTFLSSVMNSRAN